MRCDREDGDLCVIFGTLQTPDWLSMRLNIQNIKDALPLYSHTPIYPAVIYPTFNTPVERLTFTLLNAMELNLRDAYLRITNMIKQRRKIPIILTDDEIVRLTNTTSGEL